MNEEVTWKEIQRLRNKLSRGGEPTTAREKEIYREYKHMLPYYGEEYEAYLAEWSQRRDREQQMVQTGAPYQDRGHSMPTHDVYGNVVGYVLPEELDPEIAEFVVDLNLAGISTTESCSGHGRRDGYISLATEPTPEQAEMIRELGRERGATNIEIGYYVKQPSFTPRKLTGPEPPRWWVTFRLG